MLTLAGIVLIAVIVVGVAVAVLSNSGTKAGPAVGSPGAKKAVADVNGLLNGIPQSGSRLGSKTAKVTVTEYGDLQCPICRDFALGAQQQLIANEVRAGKVALV